MIRLRTVYLPVLAVHCQWDVDLWRVPQMRQRLISLVKRPAPLVPRKERKSEVISPYGGVVLMTGPTCKPWLCLTLAMKQSENGSIRHTFVRRYKSREALAFFLHHQSPHSFSKGL